MSRALLLCFGSSLQHMQLCLKLVEFGRIQLKRITTRHRSRGKERNRERDVLCGAVEEW